MALSRKDAPKEVEEMEYVERIAEKINGISVSGNQVVGQLKQIFSPAKKQMNWKPRGSGASFVLSRRTII